MYHDNVCVLFASLQRCDVEEVFRVGAINQILSATLPYFYQGD